MIHGIPQNISRCGCAERPRCQMYGGACERYADGYAIVPASWFAPWRFTSKFTCAVCWDYFCRAWATKIPGWDRPEWADDEWKPSVDAVTDLARRAINEGKPWQVRGVG
jgi:hypothetical protein